MKVKTPRGELFELREHATVLEFARVLHRDLVAHVRSARVGTRHLGLLDALRDNETVYLNVEPHPRPLPSRFREVIGDRAIVRSIERAFATSYRGRLELLGRRALTRRLLSAGLGLGLDELLPDESIDEAECRENTLLDRLVGAVLGRGVPLAHFYTDLALLEVDDQETVPVARTLSDEVEWLLPRVYQEAVAEEYRRREPEWSAVQVELCAVCFDGVGPAWIEAEHGPAGARILRCHKQGARCRGVWRRAGRAVLDAPPTPYIHVRARERRGITADIAAALVTLEISLQALVARATGTSAVLRLEVDQASEATMRRMKTALEAIDGIQKVYGPRDRIPDTLEIELRDPRPREQVSELSPYDVGGLIRNRRRLYGREHQIEQLHAWLNEALRRDVAGGRAAWVLGPYKYGKSSLVETVFEMRRAQSGHPVVMVRTEGIRNEPWSRYSHKLALALLHGVAAARLPLDLEGCGVPAPDPEADGSAGPYPLLRLVTAIRQRLDLPVVIAIDEMLSLFSATGAHEASRMVSTFRGLLSIPAVALVLVGPDLRWTVQDEEVLRLLRESEKVHLEPLERQQAYDLIQRKQTGRRVAMPATLMRSIYNATLGHPLWMQLIADKMWTEVRVPGRRRKYSKSIFDDALDAVAAVDRLPFTQHVSLLSEDTPVAAAMRAFLARLMERSAAVEFVLEDFRAQPQAGGLGHRTSVRYVETMEAVGIAVRVKPHGRPYRPVHPEVRFPPRAPRWQVPPVLVSQLKRNRIFDPDTPEPHA
jgi:hypothetical protein